MSIADDLVDAHHPWINPTLTTYLRAVGAMFAQLEGYVDEPDEPDPPVPFVYRPNLVLNPGFDYDTIGGAPAWWTSSQASPTTFQAQNAWATYGSSSLRLTSSSTASGQLLGWVTPSGQGGILVTAGALYGARADVNVLANAAAGSTPSFRISWYDASGAFISDSAGAAGLLTAGVRTLKVGPVAAPANAAFAQLRVLALSGASGQTLDGYLDSVMLQQGGPCDLFFNGDIAGYKWLGTPGNSVSAQAWTPPNVGWSKMLDVDQADYAGLPYLAQWIGEQLPQGVTDPAARAWIKAAPNSNRGMLKAIVGGIFPYLTGTQSVFTRERWNQTLGAVDPDFLSIRTYATETPDQTRLIDRLRRKLVPADISIDYGAMTVATWAGLESGSPTWATLESGSPTWAVREGVTPGYVPPGFTQWNP